VKRLGAVIAIMACTALATGMSAWPAQAASTRAASSADPNTWQSYAGAQDYMVPESLTAGAQMHLNALGVDFTSTGCETTTGFGGTGPYCHQQVVYDGQDTGLCLSIYGLSQGEPLVLEPCDATGGGQQVDQLWIFDSTTGSFPGPGYLENINEGGTCALGCIAASNGDDGDPVVLGELLSATNELWYLRQVS
jgi:hypothetical protein